MPGQLISRRRLCFLVLVGGLHLWLVYLLLGALHRQPSDPARKAAYLVIVQLAPAQLVQQPRPARPSKAYPVAARAKASPPPTADTEALVSTEPVVLAASAAAAASEPAGLNAEATGRALREAAHNPSLAYRARVRDGRAAATMGQRLEAGVTTAGRRDCLNGKLNPGARGDSTVKYSPIPVSGILLAPFVVADALLDKCGL